MKNKGRGIVWAILVLVGIFSLCSCTDKKPRTVVLEDSAQASGAAESGKVYLYNSFSIIDNEPLDEQLFGWVDNNNAADLIYKEKTGESVIESVNYKYHFTKEIMPLTDDIINYGLSPDGRNLAYVQKGGDQMRFLVREIKSGTEKELSGMDGEFLISGVGIGWSKNGRYLTYSLYAYETGTYNAAIFDLNNGESRQITLTLPKADESAQSDILSAAVSDDGEKLLISVAYNANNETSTNSAFLYSIKTNALIPAKEFQSYRIRYPDFLSANEIMFIDGNSSKLYLYDMEKDETTEIGDYISYFKLSNDGKNIVYAEYSDDKEYQIYTASLNGTALVNKTQVYQGLYPQDIWWSQDKSKILLRGWFIHIYLKPEAVPAEDFGNILETIIIELQ
jgi:hypothetical protein